MTKEWKGSYNINYINPSSYDNHLKHDPMGIDYLSMRWAIIESLGSPGIVFIQKWRGKGDNKPN